MRLLKNNSYKVFKDCSHRDSVWEHEFADLISLEEGSVDNAFPVEL